MAASETLTFFDIFFQCSFHSYSTTLQTRKTKINHNQKNRKALSKHFFSKTYLRTRIRYVLNLLDMFLKRKLLSRNKKYLTKRLKMLLNIWLRIKGAIPHYLFDSLKLRH